VNKLELIKQEAQGIIEVLSQYYKDDALDYIEDSDMLFFPLGCINYCKERERWTTSHDFAFIQGHIDVRLCAQIVQELIDSGIDIIVVEGYWTITDEDMVILDTVWESQIQEVMEEKELCFEEAFISILDRIFKVDSEEDIDKSNLH
jgi:hypothetical protein